MSLWGRKLGVLVKDLLIQLGHGMAFPNNNQPQRQVIYTPLRSLLSQTHIPQTQSLPISDPLSRTLSEPR